MKTTKSDGRLWCPECVRVRETYTITPDHGSHLPLGSQVCHVCYYVIVRGPEPSLFERATATKAAKWLYMNDAKFHMVVDQLRSCPSNADEVTLLIGVITRLCELHTEDVLRRTTELVVAAPVHEYHPPPRDRVPPHLRRIIW